MSDKPLSATAAWRKAGEYVGLVYYGRNKYRVSYPWRYDDLDGPCTESCGAHAYHAACRVAAEFRAELALRLMGFDAETAEWISAQMRDLFQVPVRDAWKTTLARARRHEAPA